MEGSPNHPRVFVDPMIRPGWAGGKTKLLGQGVDLVHLSQMVGLMVR